MRYARTVKCLIKQLIERLINYDNNKDSYTHKTSKWLKY